VYDVADEGKANFEMRGNDDGDNYERSEKCD